MSSKPNKPVLATATLASGLLLAGSAFAATPLAQGYMLGAQDTGAATQAKTQEGGCGAKKSEGSCGMDKMDTDKDGKISSAEFGAAHGGDTSKFAAHDPNGDGFVDAAEMDAHHAAKKAEAGAKADMEGKCGEGKCGGSK
ncbi:HvfA family oxazolone/thioamide-modified RiPP metallophore [Lysobacter sp. F6437]|uniref:HvfA family oxazolone/thioamide-modified RiPP metallophore n=1 Tax=Lysobacter sp. F6437 TaxID=3459296 RepID=UPI00403DDA9D